MVQKYDEEIKANALKLAKEIGVSATAKRLGISTKNLYNWRRSERIKTGQPHGPRLEQIWKTDYRLSISRRRLRYRVSV